MRCFVTDADFWTESHHIYQDSTGFKYDIQVTKVDARHNRNERWGLTVSIPPTAFSAPPTTPVVLLLPRLAFAPVTDR